MPKSPRCPVSQFLRDNHLSQYEKLFVNAGFDGPESLKLVMEMNDEDMKEIGIHKLGHRRMLKSAIQSLKNEKTNAQVREFITGLAQSLQLTTVRDFHQISPAYIRQNGGVGILLQFNDSYPLLLSTGL